jgi:hypothetical protein
MTGIAIAAGLSAVTVVLLLVLTWTWVGSYREFRTPLVLGLVAFSVVLLVQNAIGLYFYFFSMGSLYVDDPTIAWVVAFLHALQLLAVAAFTYASLK